MSRLTDSGRKRQKLYLFERYERMLRVRVPAELETLANKARKTAHLEASLIYAAALSLLPIFLATMLWSTFPAYVVIGWCGLMQVIAGFLFFSWHWRRRHMSPSGNPQGVARIVYLVAAGVVPLGVFSVPAILQGPLDAVMLWVMCSTVIVSGGVLLMAILPLASTVLFIITVTPMLFALNVRFFDSAIVSLFAYITLFGLYGFTSRYLHIRAIGEVRKTKALMDASLQLGTQAADRARVVASTSHELRTPLNAIIGFSEVMKHQLFGQLEPPRYREYTDHIHDSALHLLSVIDDLLDLSKMEAGQDELEENEFPLGELADAAMTIIGKQSCSKGLELRNEIDARLRDSVLLADRRRIMQALLNLVSNAAKYTPDGGFVRLSARAAAGGDLEISITDNGLGMSHDEVQQALRPFERTSSASISNQQGTGLGLPITRMMLNMHDGDLHVLSRKGQGTTMTMVLPRGRWRQPELQGATLAA